MSNLRDRLAIDDEPSSTGSKVTFEAISNYYHIHNTLSEYLDATVDNPSGLKLIANSDKKTDRVDAKQLIRMIRLGSIPESYVPTNELRQARTLVRRRQNLKRLNRVDLVLDHPLEAGD